MSLLHDKLADLVQRMVGRKANRSDLFNKLSINEHLNYGYSQFNEVLFLLGYDRIHRPFFNYLSDNKSEIDSLYELEKSIENFLKIALLFFGNINVAFQTLSKSEEALNDVLTLMMVKDVKAFKERHLPILTINKIPSDKTFYLGYLIERAINKTLEENPNDPEALEQKRIRNEIVEQGKMNQEAYLASDHMDVYVATSMREKHEFLIVSRICDQIFSSQELEEFNLRYFDPTQAYCADRIDKGLSEGLMLKRAVCTIYMAQETDTLGKDSELASTLAQGKPVIAYVPEGTEREVEELIDDLIKIQQTKGRKELILEQLRIFDPVLAWKDPKIINADEKDLMGILKAKVRSYYDKRAQTLSESHPLGIQVDLRSGVANGVLVVRSIENCIKLLRAVLENSLSFELESKEINGNTYWLLKEKISGCIFRAITGNESLTNSFWNHYLEMEDFEDY